MYYLKEKIAIISSTAFHFFRHKQIDCLKVRLGSEYGGWVICPKALNENSIVYSCGIGEDISFDIDLIKRYGIRVFAFDPTPRSIDWIRLQKLPDKFRFYNYGISDNDEAAVFYAPKNPKHVSYTILKSRIIDDKGIQLPVKRLTTVMKELSHDHIDILKMDIEGSEYAVIEDMLCSGIRPAQLIVEFHHHFDNISILKTFKIIRKCCRAGYKIFSISPNKREYSFILT